MQRTHAFTPLPAPDFGSRNSNSMHEPLGVKLHTDV